MNDLPVLDPRPLRDLLDLGGASELIQELIALFQEDVPPRMALLKTALDASDASQAVMEAHQLKGALSNLGLVRFADLASQIEAQAREGHLDQTGKLAEALPSAYGDALLALNSTYPRD
jgi:HPt (histidine-containing phosphotransfer) domain-containing protein